VFRKLSVVQSPAGCDNLAKPIADPPIGRSQLGGAPEPKADLRWTEALPESRPADNVQTVDAWRIEKRVKN